MKLIPILALFLVGCTNTSVIEQLAIEPEERGFVRVNARIDVNNNPFATTWADILYCEYGDGFPENVELPEC